MPSFNCTVVPSWMDVSCPDGPARRSKLLAGAAIESWANATIGTKAAEEKNFMMLESEMRCDEDGVGEVLG